MEQDIKSTILLPKTDFSMKANLKDLEKKVLEKWNTIDLYAKIRQKHQDKKKFVLHDGPPYANGSIHVGHALNKVLKDIMVKAYGNMGYNSPFVMGWDCHGLPIEWKIEEKYRAEKLNKDDIDKNTFRLECRNFAQSWVNIQQEELKSLGILSDDKNPYLTMNYSTEAIIVEKIFELVKQGVVYQGKKPIMWSCVEKTALAEAEVEYQDKTSDTVYAGFKVVKFHKENWLGSQAVIWTTTPWTLPANQAIAYSSTIEYGLYKVEAVEENSLVSEGINIIIAKDLETKVFNEIGVSKFSLLDSNMGLESLEAQHCLFELGYNYVVPALFADFVTTDAGTGIVHIAPSHGEDDFYLCKNNNITPKEVLLDSGNYIDTLPLFASEHIFKVNDKIIAKLQENNTCLGNAKVKHSYPHSWRSKAPLIYMLRSQWFISLDKNNTREQALKAIEKVDFVPKTAKTRLKSMIENRPDWCISRQRSWGVPLSIFVHKTTKEILVDETLFGNIINAYKEMGADAWFAENPLRFLPNNYNKDDYFYVSDVVDVWLDSGLTHSFVLQQRPDLNYPADVYLEGSDQHRGWFQSSLILGILLTGVAPFKKILTHGFVLDEKSQKMSKSLGNVMVPNKIIEDYGADVLRIWVATCNYLDDVTIGKNILSQCVEYYRKIRNTLRYLLANLHHFKEESNYADYSEIDKLILHKVYAIDELFNSTFKDSLNFHVFFNKVFSFIQSDLSSFYFDIKKDLLYCNSPNSTEFKSTVSVLNILFVFLSKWLSPFIPFTMEEAYTYSKVNKVDSIFLEDFQDAKSEWLQIALNVKWDRIQQIRKVVMGALEQKRSSKEIGSSLEASPILYLGTEDLQLVENIDLAVVCITSDIIVDSIVNCVEDECFALSGVEYSNIFVKFMPHTGHKCNRCWKLFHELHNNNLCERCSAVVHNKGD